VGDRRAGKPERGGSVARAVQVVRGVEQHPTGREHTRHLSQGGQAVEVADGVEAVVAEHDEREPARLELAEVPRVGQPDVRVGKVGSTGVDHLLGVVDSNVVVGQQSQQAGRPSPADADVQDRATADQRGDRRHGGLLPRIAPGIQPVPCSGRAELADHAIPRPFAAVDPVEL